MSQHLVIQDRECVAVIIVDDGTRLDGFLLTLRRPYHHGALQLAHGGAGLSDIITQLLHRRAGDLTAPLTVGHGAAKSVGSPERDIDALYGNACTSRSGQAAHEAAAGLMLFNCGFDGLSDRPVAALVVYELLGFLRVLCPLADIAT